jgi:hypothetical protein
MLRLTQVQFIIIIIIIKTRRSMMKNILPFALEKRENVGIIITLKENWFFLEDNLSVIFISLYVLFGPAIQLDESVDVAHSQLYQQMHLNVTERSSRWSCSVLQMT